MIVKKHCEWCGVYSENCYYRFVVEPKYTIFLDSPFVKEIDPVNGRVILKNGDFIECTQIASIDKVGIFYDDVLTHIFCSEKCEDNFINTFASFINPELKYQSAVYSNPNVFNPMIFDIDAFDYENETCCNCSNKFPNITKIFTLIPINDVKIISGKYKEIPKEAGYHAVLSDIDEKHLLGNYYLFNLDTDKTKWTKTNFCSNECTFDFAKENNMLVMFKNNMIKGYTTCISEFTIKINNGLANEYKYRPQILSRK